MKKVLSCLSVFVLVLMCDPTLAQKREFRDPNKRPQDFLVPASSALYMKSKEYKDAHERLERDFWWLHEAEEKKEILAQSSTAILRTLESNKDFWKVAKARYWCMKNAPRVVPDLIRLLANPKMVGLEGYADLIIWERIESKDLPFYGHGWVASDDLFSVAGRASWILKEITGQQFPAVSMKSTPSELKQLSEAWAAWYEKNK